MVLEVSRKKERSYSGGEVTGGGGRGNSAWISPPGAILLTRQEQWKGEKGGWVQGPAMRPALAEVVINGLEVDSH
jgi:hypothetical protein